MRKSSAERGEAFPGGTSEPLPVVSREVAAEVSRRVLLAVDLHAELCLADIEPAHDGRGGHPDIDAESGDIGFPDVLGQIK